MLVQDKLRQFLTKELNTVTEEGVTYKIELSHLPIESKSRGERVNVWEVGESTDANDLAITIEQEALRDASTIERYQKYVVHTYRDGRRKAPAARVLFAMEGEKESGTELATEPANMRGLMSQLMRHNEALAKLAVGRQAESEKHHGALLARLFSVQEEQINKRLELVHMIEDLTSQREERQNAAMIAQSKAKAFEETATSVRALLPSVAEKVLNKGSNGKTDLVREKFTALMSTLTEEQKSKLMESFGGLDLNPGQAIAAMELFKQVQDAETE